MYVPEKWDGPTCPPGCETGMETDYDPINHPQHYTSSPAKCSACGHPIECIDITRHYSFPIGNVFKYLWRAYLKGMPLEDLQKAAFYLNDAIATQKKAEDSP